jgi:hypothetical protein
MFVATYATDTHQTIDAAPAVGPAWFATTYRVVRYNIPRGSLQHAAWFVTTCRVVRYTIPRGPLQHTAWSATTYRVVRYPLGTPPPHLHRDWAHHRHICTGTGGSHRQTQPGASGSTAQMLRRDNRTATRRACSLSCPAADAVVGRRGRRRPHRKQGRGGGLASHRIALRREAAVPVSRKLAHDCLPPCSREPRGPTALHSTFGYRRRRRRRRPRMCAANVAVVAVEKADVWGLPDASRGDNVER